LNQHGFSFWIKIKFVKWISYIYVFFLAHIKFLFAASIAEITTDLTFLEILITTTLGSLFCFNVCFFISNNIFHRRKQISRPFSFLKNRKKRNFKKRNRIIVKIKNSRGGFFLLCALAPLFLSVPIGTIVVSKFFGKRNGTYLYVSIVLIFSSFLLAYLNHFIFN